MRASSVARLISARVMSSSRLSRCFLAASFPFAPAMLYHMCASTESLRTPRPLAYMPPRLNCASARPCSAASRDQRHGFGIVLEDALAIVVHEPEGTALAWPSAASRYQRAARHRLRTPRPCYMAPRASIGVPCSAAIRYQQLRHRPSPLAVDPEGLRLGVARCHTTRLDRPLSTPFGVHDPEANCGSALFGGQPEPFHGFGIVLRDALAVGVHEPEVVRLRRRPAPSIGVCPLNFGGGSEPVPFRSFGIVLGVHPRRMSYMNPRLNCALGVGPARRPTGTISQLRHCP